MNGYLKILEIGKDANKHLRNIEIDKIISK